MTAAELIALQKELGWTWALLADYLVRDPRTVRRWRRNKHPIPTVVAEALLNAPRLQAFAIWIDLLSKKTQARIRKRARLSGPSFFVSGPGGLAATLYPRGGIRQLLS